MNAVFKKITKVLAVILVVLLFLVITFEDFEEENADITNLVGEKVIGAQLSINEYVMLCEKTIGIYISAARSGDFATTYSLLTKQYKEVVDYETYVESVKDLDFSKAYIADIKILTATTYEANVVYNEEESQKYLIILDDSDYYIVPENFLIHKEVNNDIKKKNVKYTLLSYEVYTDSVIFNVSIENETGDNILISSATMTDSAFGSFEEEFSYTIAPDETKVISVEFETEIDFPAEFSITRETDKKYLTYTFEL